MHIHYFQHLPFEGLGFIKDWALSRKHSLSVTRFYEPNPVYPDMADIDWLIVMGGTMAVYEADQHDWMPHEKQFIRQAIEAGKVVIGVCLGAQFLAEALGGRVYPGKAREIGWFPVQLSEAGQQHPLFQGIPKQFTTLHWHGDTFDLPAGISRLASSELTVNQTFCYDNRVLALQFHPEATRQGVLSLSEADRQSLNEKSQWVNTYEQILKGLEYIPENNQILQHILSKLELLNSKKK